MTEEDSIDWKAAAAEFWAEFKDQYLENVILFTIAVAAVLTTIFLITLPIALVVATEVAWWFALYLLILPGLFTALVVLSAGHSMDDEGLQP